MTVADVVVVVGARVCLGTGMAVGVMVSVGSGICVDGAAAVRPGAGVECASVGAVVGVSGVGNRVFVALVDGRSAS